MKRLAVALVVACWVLGSAAPALGDSLVFIRGANVWLSNPDGSGEYQVTFDGSSAAPYESPSQSDDGTIVAIRETPGARRQIYRMTQSGIAAEPADQHAGPGHRRDRRQGLAERAARRVLVRHHRERPDLHVLRGPVQSRADQPRRPLHESRRGRPHPEHRDPADVGVQRRAAALPGLGGDVVLPARRDRGLAVVGRRRDAFLAVRRHPQPHRRRRRAHRRPDRDRARRQPGDDRPLHEQRLPAAAPGGDDRADAAAASSVPPGAASSPRRRGRRTAACWPSRTARASRRCARACRPARSATSIRSPARPAPTCRPRRSTPARGHRAGSPATPPRAAGNRRRAPPAARRPACATRWRRS